MQKIKVLFLSLVLSFSIAQNSHGAAAGIAAIVGAPSAGASLALYGLASTGAGFFLTATSRNCDGGGCVVYFVLGAALGVVLLDDDGAMEFSKLAPSAAEALKLNKQEISVYNSELDELNAVVDQISSELSEKIFADQAEGQKLSQQLWQEYGEFLSAETVNVAQKIVSQQ